MLKPLSDRLSERSLAVPSGCIEWAGPRHDVYGHCRMKFEGRMQYVHRLAWIVAHGPIPAGRVVRHRCDNGACLNVEHLELGTQADNVADMFTRSRVDRGGQRNSAARLTQEQVAEIRGRLAAGELGKDLAAEFGMSTSQISNIRTNKKWKEAS